MHSGRRIYSSVLALTVLWVQGGAGLGGEGEPDRPPELPEIVKRNSESLRRLRSCTATVEKSFSMKEKKGVWSHDIVYTLWVKGRKVREYLVAKPRDAMTEAAVDFDAGDRAPKDLSIPPGGTHGILTPEARIGYVPAAKLVNILPGRPDLPYGRSATLLHRYACGGVMPLEETAAMSAKNGGLLTIREVDLDGVPCVLLSWDFAATNMGKQNVWVVPSQGYMICKRQVTYNTGEVMTECTARIREYKGGVFWFDRAEERSWTKKGVLYRHLVLVVKDFKPNVELDDKLFTLEALGVPPGTEVKDWTLDTRTRGHTH